MFFMQIINTFGCLWKKNSIFNSFAGKNQLHFHLQISSGMKEKYYVNKKAKCLDEFKKKTLNLIFSLIRSNIYTFLSFSAIKKKSFSLNWLGSYLKKHKSMMHLFFIMLISMKICESLCGNIYRKYKILKKGGTTRTQVI